MIAVALCIGALRFESSEDVLDDLRHGLVVFVWLRLMPFPTYCGIVVVYCDGALCENAGGR